MNCTAKRAARIRRVSSFAIRALFRVLLPGANLAYSVASVVCFLPADLHFNRRAGSAWSASQQVQIYWCRPTPRFSPPSPVCRRS